MPSELIEFLKRKHPEIYRKLIFKDGRVYITRKGVEMFKEKVDIKELLEEFDC